MALKRSSHLNRVARSSRSRVTSVLDEETGLPTRPAFLKALARAAREGSGTLVFVGLDDFQHVNDFLGHVVGNDVLRGVADRLREVFGQSAVVARLTGVEFAVLLPDVVSEDEGSVF